MSSFATTISSMGPVGWWRLGEASGTAVTDASGRGHTGTYHSNPTLGISGAVVGDANTAIQVNASQSQYVEVPDHVDFSLTKAQDGFNRTVSASSSWGTADQGGIWVAQVSEGNYYSCHDGQCRIDETSTGATWQQGLSLSIMDVDLQVRAAWNSTAAGGPLQPLTLVARRRNPSNFYRAELRENEGGQLDLRLIKTVDGTSMTLATAEGVGTYVVNDWWYVRFQVEGSSLRAKAWKRDTPQPATWTVTAVDSFLPSAGTIGIRSANSSSAARPVVSFEGFRAQSVGMTVHVWMRPDLLDFPGEYVYFLGKGESGQYEWAFRFRPSSSPDRPNQISTYHWNLKGGLGAGVGWQPNPPDDPLTVGTWHQVVAVFDPGDTFDTEAGVTFYKDGESVDFARYTSWEIYPLKGSAPLRFGTRSHNLFFTGGLDEVAIFNRKLTDSEIMQLYTTARQNPSP